MAAKQGLFHKGYVDSIYVITYGELIRTVARYSGMSPIDVRSVLDDLTYGNSGITSPVPALQPLIKLNLKYYAIVPNIWICSAAERNFISLINRFPSDKKNLR